MPRSQHLFSLWDIGAILYPCQYPIEQWCPIISILLATMRNMRLSWDQCRERGQKKIKDGWNKRLFWSVVLLTSFIKKYLCRFLVCGSDVRCGGFIIQSLLIITILNSSQLGSDRSQPHRAIAKWKYCRKANIIFLWVYCLIYLSSIKKRWSVTTLLTSEIKELLIFSWSMFGLCVRSPRSSSKHCPSFYYGISSCAQVWRSSIIQYQQL